MRHDKRIMNTSSFAKALPDLFRQAAQQYAQHTAIVFGERRTDFQTFNNLSDRVAAGLAAQGIHQGDRVGLYCINSDFFAIAYVGIVKAGATVVPINLLLNPKEVAFILQDAEAKALVYFALFDENIKAIRPALQQVSLLVRIGQTPAPPDTLDFSALLHSTADVPSLTFNPDEDLVAILYTSGTTGRPKGAMLTHRNLYANTESIRLALKLTPGQDVLLLVLPMFHAFAATVGMLFPLLNGCTIVPLPKFDPAQVADAIEAHQATVFMAVPSMYNVLLRLPDEAVSKFASLKVCVSGAAALPVEVMRQFEEKFGHPIYEGDGPTECSPVTCVNPIGGRRKPGSVGVCVPHVDMEIRDDHGHEVPRGEIGEICVCGPNVMKGYWNHPEETAKAFFGDWFRTGDLGYEDEEGYFFIVDRKKDMIIVNGMNVYPRVVEEALYHFAPVREVAVVGVPSTLHGEIPVAFVSLKENASASPDEIRAHCREHLGRHEVPRKIFIMEDLPKNAAGKIMKRELRKSGEIERGVDIPTHDV
jgi:long-chain acyl-CoA synthetase